MDDRYSEYVIAMESLCASAELASLQLEMVTTAGQVLVGLISMLRSAGDDQSALAGSQSTVWIDDRLINLDEVVRCAIYSPEIT